MVLRRRSVERRYQIGRRIATGGMSEIYEASASDLDRKVVVKRLIAADGREDDLESRFLREAAVAATLDHPNVVELIDMGQHQKDFVLIMEHVDGLSLAEILAALTKDGGVLDVDVVCGIVAQVARGLSHAHERTLPDGTPLGIVHRDVAPDNILITRDGLPRIADFGVATLEGHHLTQPGTVKGRPLYLSPEQARAEKVDARTDVFALGAVMFEMLAAEPLYSGENEAALLFRVQEGAFEPVRERLADVDPDLASIVARAIEANLDARLRSARELEKELDRFRAARGLRVDRRTIARVVESLFPAVTQEREARFKNHRGELQGSLLVLPPDENDPEITDPRTPIVLPRQSTPPPADAPQPARKKRLERLPRMATPDLKRPPALPAPENPAKRSLLGLSGLHAVITGRKPPSMMMIMASGVVFICLVIVVLTWLR